MQFFKVVIFFFIVLLLGNGSTQAKLQEKNSVFLKKNEINVESLSKRYFEYEDIDSKLLYGVEYTLTFSLPARYKNEQNNYHMELVLPKGIASIFGTNIEEINQNDGFEIKNGKAYFSIPCSIATSKLTLNQKEYILNNKDIYTVKIYSKKNNLIKQEVIKTNN